MKPVTIPTHAFIFCRYSISVFVWLAWILQSPWILALAAVVLGFSALLKVQRAPMILLYSKTILPFIKSPEEILDETAMRFAHVLGTVFASVCLIAVFIFPAYGWRLTFLFAVLKTISALGYCPASKLFTCATNTTCCPITKRVLGVCQPKTNPDKTGPNK